MRRIFSAQLEEGRLLTGPLRSRFGQPHGAFLILGPEDTLLRIISSGTGPHAEGWEHVSVSTEKRTPSWTEMCFVKDHFWREDEVVMQLHPAKADYVNHHPYCLHMWRPLDADIPLPPSNFVGPKDK
jgi:hypothetical protein